MINFALGMVLLAVHGVIGFLLIKAGLKKRLSVWTGFEVGLLAGPILLSLMALFLADLGLYKPVWIWGVTGVLLAVGLFFARGKTLLLEDQGPGKREWLVLGLLLLVGFGVFCRPFQYLRGGWDPGEYVSSALNLHRTGSLKIEDPLFTSFSSEEQTALSHQPLDPRSTLHAGFLIHDEKKGIVVPDYFHLYPAWLGLFADQHDVARIYWGQTLLSLMALAVFFLAVRRLFGFLPATLAAGLYAVSPGIAYFSRFSTSEMMTTLCLFSGFAFLCLAVSSEERTFMMASAICFMASLLSHITSAIPLGLLSGALLSLGWRQKDRLLLFGGFMVVLLCGLAGIRIVLMSKPFIDYLIWFFSEGHIYFTMGGLIVGLLALGVWYFFMRNKERVSMGYRKVDYLFQAVVLLVVIFFYFVRPAISDHHEALNMRVLGWVVSPLGLMLATVWLLCKPPSSWRLPQNIFMITGLITTLMLLSSKFIIPMYMWGIRRYVPLLIPFVLCLCGWGLAVFFSMGRRGKLAGAVLTVGFVGWLSVNTSAVLKVREFKGLPDFLTEVAAAIPDSDLVICDHWKYATPLRYAFGLPAYQLSRQSKAGYHEESRTAEKLMARSVAAGRKVYYVSYDHRFFHPEFHLEQVGSMASESTRLKLRQSAFPRRTQTEREKAMVFQLKPGSHPVESAYKIELGYHALGLVSGFHDLSKSKEIAYRWTDGNGALYVPVLKGPAKYRLHLAVKRKDPKEETIPVKILLGGREVALFDAETDWKIYAFDYTPEAGEEPVQTMNIVSSVWDPAEFGIQGYPPNLGVRVDWVEVEALQE